MSKIPEPPISDGLLDYLRTLYPDRCPTEDMSVRQVWMAAGAAQVVRKLEQVQKSQLAKSKVIQR